MEQAEAREAAKVSPERPIAELELGKRATDSLEKAGISNVGQVLDMLQTGEASLLAVEGFGRKSLADLKKRLRQLGYQLPEAAQEIQV
ncbi:MAG: DNA-directed RNA polymerase subunit alpha C-terminal domain-containing protein [Anaerolineales bacterium]